jgi:membrane protein DedA with SNARE-associated domain
MGIATLAGLALSTLISEDLASISAGLLVREQQLPLMHAVAACVIGVYLGDLGLWWTGRLAGRGVLALPRLTHVLRAGRPASLIARMDVRLGLAILVSRFVPGSRLPMYVALGIWGRRPLAFAAWSLVAVMMWTPLLVASTVYVGDAVVGRLLTGLKADVVAVLLTAVVVLGAAKLVGRAVARTARRYHQRFDQTIETPI